jgi:hypothetical protein
MVYADSAQHHSVSAWGNGIAAGINNYISGHHSGAELVWYTIGNVRTRTASDLAL